MAGSRDPAVFLEKRGNVCGGQTKSTSVSAAKATTKRRLAAGWLALKAKILVVFLILTRELTRQQ
jgi:hypothetical protein